MGGLVPFWCAYVGYVRMGMCLDAGASRVAALMC